jgi:hypothetical protein
MSEKEDLPMNELTELTPKADCVPVPVSTESKEQAVKQLRESREKTAVYWQAVADGITELNARSKGVA